MQNMSTIPIWLCVAIGGALGSVLRHATTQLVGMSAGQGFPYAVIIVNVVGSFLMGALAIILSARFGDHAMLRSFLMIGVLGGFTTFSAFSLDVFSLIERSQILLAGVYVLSSVIVSILAVFAGIALGKAII